MKTTPDMRLYLRAKAFYLSKTGPAEFLHTAELLDLLLDDVHDLTTENKRLERDLSTLRVLNEGAHT